MRVFSKLLVTMACVLLFSVARPAAADPGASAAVVADGEHAAPGERELLARLVAPCCWNQTLDIHAGDAPDRLRAEIRERLLAGEAAAAIEADFVARYGERVRAQSSSSLLGSAGLVVIGLALIAGVGVALAARRWVRASERSASRVVVSSERDALDVRLDDELRAMD